MTIQGKALIWAAFIIVAALAASASNMTDNASFALITGLTGAAWASIQSQTNCKRGCAL